MIECASTQVDQVMRFFDSERGMIKSCAGDDQLTKDFET